MLRASKQQICLRAKAPSPAGSFRASVRTADFAPFYLKLNASDMFEESFYIVMVSGKDKLD